MTEVHTDENHINTNNVMISNILSENEVMNNETQVSNGTDELSKSTTISISESVIAENNLHTIEKEKVNSNQSRNMYTTLQKYYLPVTMIILICIIVITLQIPTVLYYTDLPSAESMLYENINLETCSVS